MFVDEVTIVIKSGNGGDGTISFRREKAEELGGPDGGDGGKGGNVIFVSTHHLNTLHEFNNKKVFEAPKGANGGPKKMTGASGEDLIIKVPLGTVIREYDTNILLADFKKEETKVLLEGGEGGRGNVHFRNSEAQAPYLATKGKKGKELKLKLELKLLADVGLVGFPNAGKSTLINTISNAKSKVADYAFSTLSPKLGVVHHSGKSFVISDIPGLIEGASQGKGLGFEFLRHIERCKIIWHLVDVSEENVNFIEKFEKLNEELRKYSERLANKKQLVLFSKFEKGLIDEEKVTEFENYVKEKGYKTFNISSHMHLGLTFILDRTIELLDKIKEQEVHLLDQEEEVPLSTIFENIPREEDIVVHKETEGVYNVRGRIIKQVKHKYIFAGVNSSSMYLNILRKLGLEHALRSAGVKQGDTIKIFDEEFQYVE